MGREDRYENAARRGGQAIYLYLIKGRCTAIHKLPLSVRAPGASKDDGYRGNGGGCGSKEQSLRTATHLPGTTFASSQPFRSDLPRQLCLRLSGTPVVPGRVKRADLITALAAGHQQGATVSRYWTTRFSQVTLSRDCDTFDLALTHSTAGPKLATVTRKPLVCGDDVGYAYNAG